MRRMSEPTGTRTGSATSVRVVWALRGRIHDETAGSVFSSRPRRFTAAERRALWQKERRNGS